MASRRVPVMACPSFDRLMMLLTPSTDQCASCTRHAACIECLSHAAQRGDTARLYHAEMKATLRERRSSLGDDQLRPELPAHRERSGELWSITALAALNLCKLSGQHPVAAVEIIANELTLRVEPKAAVAWRSVETR